MSDAPAKPVSPLAVLLVLGASALFLVFMFFAYASHRTGPFVGDGIHTAEQRLERLAELRANEQSQLHSYAWIDRPAGVIRLPIDRAMELTVETYGRRENQSGTLTPSSPK